MTDLGNSSFYDLLPPNLRDAHTRALSYASDRQFAKLTEFIQAKTLIYASVMTLDEEVCDHLALQFNLMVYEAHFPLQMKREMLSLLFLNRLKKGTTHAVKQVISAIHRGADILEWFQYDGTPHTFRIVVDDTEQSMDEDLYSLIIDNVFEYKALRSSLEHTSIGMNTGGTIFVSGVNHYKRSDKLSLAPTLPKGDVADDIQVIGMSHHRIKSFGTEFAIPSRNRLTGKMGSAGYVHQRIRHSMFLEHAQRQPVSSQITGTIQIKYKKKMGGDEDA